jgi:hypothetical protein
MYNEIFIRARYKKEHADKNPNFLKVEISPENRKTTSFSRSGLYPLYADFYPFIAYFLPSVLFIFYFKKLIID